nr:MAG TPA: hypothetical protein [Bacteriophage sp.]
MNQSHQQNCLPYLFPFCAFCAVYMCIRIDTAGGNR